MRKGVFGAVIAAAAIAIAVPAVAQSPNDTIAARVAKMKELGAASGAITAYVRENKGTPADMVKAGETMQGLALQIPTWFPKGTGDGDPGVTKNRAKMDIWAKFDDFSKAATALRAEADAFVAAARSGDREKITAAAATLGPKGCGGCHTPFRAPQS
ncbi:MAG: cytochrome c [Alphaproteobacteria bacterium]|nr:cytochrome c [Alphaproteobacteria bacterium]